jgi:hypothetical protein
MMGKFGTSVKSRNCHYIFGCNLCYINNELGVKEKKEREMIVFAFIESSLNLITAFVISDGSTKEYFRIKTILALIISVGSIIGFNLLMSYIGFRDPSINMLFSATIYTAIFNLIYRKNIQESIFLSFASMVILLIVEFIAIPLGLVFDNKLLPFVTSLIIHILIIILIMKYKLNLSKTIMFSMNYRMLDQSHKRITKVILTIMFVAAAVGSSLIAMMQMKQTLIEYIHMYKIMILNVIMVYLIYISITRTFSLENTIIVASNYKEMLKEEKVKNEKFKQQDHPGSREN